MDSVFTCPVCERECDTEIGSRHHVLPKSQGGRSVTVICRDCHKQIHRLFSVKDLVRHYTTLDALKATPPMQTWVNWIRKRPARRKSYSPLPGLGEGPGVRA